LLCGVVGMFANQPDFIQVRGAFLRVIGSLTTCPLRFVSAGFWSPGGGCSGFGIPAWPPCLPPWSCWPSKSFSLDICGSAASSSKEQPTFLVTENSMPQRTSSVRPVPGRGPGPVPVNGHKVSFGSTSGCYGIRGLEVHLSCEWIIKRTRHPVVALAWLSISVLPIAFAGRQ
jgi:hypothetical protein